jgi:hypothetical protein
MIAQPSAVVAVMCRICRIEVILATYTIMGSNGETDA